MSVIKGPYRTGRRLVVLTLGETNGPCFYEDKILGTI